MNPAPRKFKAIVLSCDPYHPFVDHMIMAYDRIWPDHPFEFRVPFQESADSLTEKFGDRVQPVKTGMHFRDTVLGLLMDLPDDEWIYWCLDDKYPLEFDIAKVNEVLELIGNPPSAQLGGILFCRPARLYWKNAIASPPNVPYLNETYLRRTDYSMIWIHQFVRVKIIRKLFESFPTTRFQAKEMDEMKYRIEVPEDCQLFVTKKSHAYFGESTTRGKMTQNCAESFERFQLPLPNGFSKSNENIYIGRDSFLGNQFKVRTRAFAQQLKYLFSSKLVSGKSKN